MRYILRQREIQPDHWHYLGESHAPASALIVPGAELRREPERWWAWSGRLGASLTPIEQIEDLQPHLRRLDLVAVSFPVFGDGRGFTQLRLLRQRYAFAGELRATGAGVTPELAHLLVRCGVDAFEVARPEQGRALARACERYDVAYQPGAPAVPVRLQRFRLPA
ncbi:MAG: DUF934 domain-containing protein [Gammaproteobacteria bacterium]|nr:DUF934 domain-containing protein [Gammaproteobacteria bacterium]MBV9620347.1 DUF934 domain-containing protein [Gammaproteobacteria bacterium]